MWWKSSFILHFVVLWNIISSQPVTDSEIIRNPRRTNFGECCPCVRDDESNIRDQDSSPSSSMDVLASVPADDCQCQLPGADLQGTPSIFRPFLLRAQSTERETQHKPLLQPEVGLASAVLETLQKATDEEYKDALARDAARSVLKVESDFLESDNSRNSVTILLNSRDDLYDDQDTIPEATHVHETRCIHSPPARERSVMKLHDATPRLTKGNLLLKRKPNGYLHKPLFDMDSGASNIHERFNENNNNDYSKSKTNPLLLNTLPTVNRDQNPNQYTRSKPIYELRNISPEYCNDIKSKDEFNNSPILKLAALRNKLRDLTEIRKTNRLNHNMPTALRKINPDSLDYKGMDSAHKLATLQTDSPSPMDTFFDKQSPMLKNILKLKDVELIPPRKTVNKDLDSSLTSDLKFAGTENDDVITSPDGNKDVEETSVECNVLDNDSDSAKHLPNNQIEREVESETTKIFENSYESQTVADKELNPENSNDSHTKSRNMNSYAQDIVENESEADILNDSFDDNSKEEMDDSVPETSNNIVQQISQEEINMEQTDPSFADGNVKEDVCYSNKEEMDGVEPINQLNDSRLKNDDPLLQNENIRTSLKDDILRRLESFKNTIKSRLQDPNFVGRNAGDTTNIQPTNEKDVTFQDLQKLSNSLLKQENSIKTNKTPSQDTERSSITEDGKDESFQDYVNFTNVLADVDNESSPLEEDIANTQQNKNEMLFENDDQPIYCESNDQGKPENRNIQNSQNKYDTISKEAFEIDADSIASKDDSTISEMSSQESDSKSLLDDNIPQNSLLQNVLIQPSRRKDAISPFSKPFPTIPSLEEIRQGITDIIDAGQQESEDFQLADFDPINEGSDLNSIVSNTKSRLNSPKSSCLEEPYTDEYRPSLLQNVRINPPVKNLDTYKSNLRIPETVTLRPILSNRAPLRDNPLSLGSDITNSVIRPKLRPSSVIKETSPLDGIRDLLKSQNHFKPSKIAIPKTDIIETPNFNTRTIGSLADDLKYQLDNRLKPDFKNTYQGNNLLSKARLESNDILETMTRKQGDMKEKLQALHLDLNDRLASFHNKLRDQTNAQSINIPRIQENGLVLSKLGPKKERNGIHSIPDSLGTMERNFVSKPKQLHDYRLLDKKIKPQKVPPFDVHVPRKYGNVGKNELQKKKETFKSKPFVSVNNIPKQHGIKLLENNKYNLGKQNSWTPLKTSKVKISFTTTTPKSIIAPKLQKRPVKDHVTKSPVKLLGKEKTADFNSNLKDISNALRSRLKTLSDSSHAPSEIIEKTMPAFKTKPDLSESKMYTNSAKVTIKDKNVHPKIIEKEAAGPFSKQMRSQDLASPNKKVTASLSSLREAIRARLENITSTSSPSTTSKTHDAPILDTIVSPSENIKTRFIDSVLKENTSYKCTMVCTKD